MTLTDPTTVVHLMRVLELAPRSFADSARWFPELHDRPRPALAAHYALGLAGELGEVIDVLTLDERGYGADELGAELADCAIYTLDLIALLELDVDAATAARRTTVRTLTQLASAVGHIANIAKKLNRGDNVAPALVNELEHPAGYVLARLVDIAEDYNLDLAEQIDLKRSVCEARWGQ